VEAVKTEAEVKTAAPAEQSGSLAETQKPGALATNGVNLGEGFEEGLEGIKLSRAKIVQSTTPEFQKAPQKYIMGTLIDNITGEQLSNEFIPLLKFTIWIRFNPRKKEDQNFDPAYDAGALIWKSTDPKDPRVLSEGEFGPNGELPKATKFVSFLAIFPGQPLPVIISFAKTSLKAGVKLYNLAVRAGGDMCSRKYTISTELVKNDEGTYYVPDVNMAGIVDEATHKAAIALKHQFQSAVSRAVEIVTDSAAKEQEEVDPAEVSSENAA